MHPSILPLSLRCAHAGIPRRQSAYYVKQADAPPLPRPGKGAGPTGAMLRPGANDIEMGVRPPLGNGVGNGGAAPPPVRQHTTC